GINLAGLVDWNTELPFVDVFRLSRRWISQRQGKKWGKGPPLTLDERGWVARLEPGCYADALLCWIQGGHYPSGEYVCLYEGEGEIQFRGAARIVSQEPGRIVLDVDSSRGGIILSVKSVNPDNYIRNIRVIMPGFEDSYRTQVFTPQFLDRWSEFNTIRFMDWMRTNGSQVATWDDRPRVDDATWTVKGAPLEIMIDLCNRLQVNPWFCMPHLADDDYVRNFAEQVRRDLDPSLKVYIEYSNEVWNSMFAATRYAGERGMELGLAEKPWEAGWRYASLRSVQIFVIWEDVFGGTGRLVRCMATQAAVPHVSEEKLAFREAWRHCDALAIAPYFGLVPTPGGKLDSNEVATWSVQQVLDYLEQTALPRAVENIAAQKKIADRYGLRLVAYEAGQHAVGARGGENNEELTTLLHEANRHERMGALYTRYLDAWRDAGGDLMCIFSSVGRWSKWGSWGLIEYVDDDTPKYRAVLRWNRGNPVEEAR
ncbi:MAG: hypothetical protein J7M38_15180, partial [Armatimonadetes bacterium]|nr:hypothetical protein [Armatimonadota bacterium]